MVGEVLVWAYLVFYSHDYPDDWKMDVSVFVWKMWTLVSHKLRRVPVPYPFPGMVDEFVVASVLGRRVWVPDDEGIGLELQLNWDEDCRSWENIKSCKVDLA